MAYDEITLKNEIINANDGDVIEITSDIYLSSVLSISKNIIMQSATGNIFTIFQETDNRHFSIGTSGILTIKNLVLNGSNIGGGIGLGTGGQLILDAGSIIQNCLSRNGGAISLGIGTATMLVMNAGSIIQNCSSELHGGGIYIGPNCIFTMEDGSVIKDCSSIEYGGGIYIAEGSFIMNGGEIIDCSSAGGGGIYLYYLSGLQSAAYIEMNGGRITGCSSPFGGGILFSSTLKVARVNTIITGNFSNSYGGGIAILDGSVVNINTGLVSGNLAQLVTGAEAQIYILSQHLPFSDGSYTLIDVKSSAIPVVLLNGDIQNLIYFKVREDNSGQYFVAFCAEPSAIVLINDYYAIYFLPNKLLSREMTDKIAITIKTAINDERSYDVIANDPLLTIRAYVAQYVIWNIVTGYYKSDELITTINWIQAALGDLGVECLNEIIDAIKLYENHEIPSFTSNSQTEVATYCLKYDLSDGKYRLTLTDTNEVLKYFTLDVSSVPQGVEVILDYDKNTMTIVCDNKDILWDGSVIIRLESLIEDGDASVYFHPLYQDLIIPDNNYKLVIEAYLKPLICGKKCNKSCPCYTTKCRKTIRGQKKWIDNNNLANARPKNIEILLLRDGEIYKTLFIDSSEDTQFQFCCLPIWKKPGIKYHYQIDERDIPKGYSKSIKGYTITNTLI